MGLNLEKFFPNMSEKEVVNFIFSLYDAGVSSKEIGKALDVTDVTIRKYFIKYNLPLKHPGGAYKGKLIHISEEEYKANTTKELMKKYDCSQFTIYNLTKHYPSRVGRSKRYGVKDG